MPAPYIAGSISQMSVLTGSSVAFNKPIGLEDNDYLLFMCAKDDNAGAFSSTGFTFQNFSSASGDDKTIGFGYKKITDAAGEPSTYTLDWSESEEMAGKLYIIRGARLSSFLDVAYVEGDHAVATDNVNGSPDLAFQPITTNTNDALVFILGGSRSDAGHYGSTMPTGYSPLLGGNVWRAGTGNGDAQWLCASKVITTAGTETPGDWTGITAGRDWATLTFAIAAQPKLVGDAVADGDSAITLTQRTPEAIMRLGESTDPTSSNHRITIRHKGSGSATVRLYESFEEIASFTTTVGASWGEDSYTLTGGEADSISEYADLQISVEENPPSETGWLQVSWLKFELDATGATYTKTHTVDASLIGVVTKAHTVDAHIISVETVTHTVDASLISVVEKTHTVDAILAGVETVEHTVDAVLLATDTKAHTVDASLVATETIAHTVDASLQATSTEEHTVDAILKATFVVGPAAGTITLPQNSETTRYSYQVGQTTGVTFAANAIPSTDIATGDHFVVFTGHSDSAGGSQSAPSGWTKWFEYINSDDDDFTLYGYYHTVTSGEASGGSASAAFTFGESQEFTAVMFHVEGADDTDFDDQVTPVAKNTQNTDSPTPLAVDTNTDGAVVIVLDANQKDAGHLNFSSDRTGYFQPIGPAGYTIESVFPQTAQTNAEGAPGRLEMGIGFEDAQMSWGWKLVETAGTETPGTWSQGGGNGSEYINLQDHKTVTMVIKPRQGGTHTVDASLVDTVAIDHTVDAHIISVVTVDHTTDAILQATDTKTHSVDAYLVDVVAVTHDVDAILLTEETVAHTVDAGIVGVVTKDHTVDTVLQATDTKAHTVDAHIVSVVTTDHTTDAVLLATDTVDTTVDAYLVSVVTKEHTVDAILLTEETVDTTVDAILQSTDTVDHTTDAILQAIEVVDHSVDAILLATSTEEHTVDAHLVDVETVVHTLDATLQATDTVEHTVDAVIGATEVAHSIDAIVLTIETVDTTVDAVLQATDTVDTTVDVILLAETTTEHTTDAVLQAEQTVEHSIDASLIATLTVNHTVDAIVITTATVDTTVDAILLATDTKTHSVDAHLVDVGTEVHTVDAHVVAVETVTHTVDAKLVTLVTITHTVDAVLQATDTADHTVDAHLVDVEIVTHSVDAVLLATDTKTHSIDATIVSVETTTHTVDAILQLTDIETHTVDAILFSLQMIVPESDISATGWDTAPVGSQELWEQIDEHPASDTDYVFPVVI